MPNEDPLVAALTASLTDAEEQLERAEAFSKMATKREQDLQAEVVGLRLAIDRRVHRLQVEAERRDRMKAGATVVHPAARTAREDSEMEIMRWRRIPRVEAILRVLAEAEDPMSPTEIASTLRSKGRNDQPGDVSGTLPSMRRRHGVKMVGRAQYVLPKAPLMEEEVAT